MNSSEYATQKSRPLARPGGMSNYPLILYYEYFERMLTVSIDEGTEQLYRLDNEFVITSYSCSCKRTLGILENPAD